MVRPLRALLPTRVHSGSVGHVHEGMSGHKEQGRFSATRRTRRPRRTGPVKPKPPFISGHEAIFLVTRVGPEVTAVKEGDHAQEHG